MSSSNSGTTSESNPYLDPTNAEHTHEHGWTAVPRDHTKVLALIGDKKPSPAKVEDVEIPSSVLAKRVMDYAKTTLPEPAFNHSMRVFYYGQIITAQLFSDWKFSPETYFIASLLHDLGTVPANQSTTRLSFDFNGAILANSLLLNMSDSSSSPYSPIPQRESVVEAIIRHQDVAGSSGNVTVLTQVLHLATLLDNAGKSMDKLVVKETVESVIRAYPRMGWSGCFASVVREEIRVKPWANSTRIDGFAELVEKGHGMSKYD